MKSSNAFFKDSKNCHCWGDCNELSVGCEGPAKPVLVFSDGKPRIMDCGEDGMPFFYCNTAIERDRDNGFRVEIVEIDQ
ncbi:hypothetical protein RE428_32240 [Marinobacter nanhaiticus D15-8W]|uniref:Uncharacterized protein n=1 Tax=Marinobacter nanhaiticus D15-8W TaxID=626887 RepID=N6WZD1_9GAMM|nr:hypothetical protein J057_01890 [Marinobacter nanhaiticus D15-8W]BES72206.1 hypothetical protein RE428_32240 [Marinobacter nanhaiticus D15-8W]